MRSHGDTWLKVTCAKEVTKVNCIIWMLCHIILSCILTGGHKHELPGVCQRLIIGSKHTDTDCEKWWLVKWPNCLSWMFSTKNWPIPLLNTPHSNANWFHATCYHAFRNGSAWLVIFSHITKTLTSSFNLISFGVYKHKIPLCCQVSVPHLRQRSLFHKLYTGE